MKFIKIENIKTEEQAKNIAIDFQSWVSNQNLSWEEIINYNNYFEEIAEKFKLKNEFRENGII